MCHFNFFNKLVVLIGLFVFSGFSLAGSYEDFFKAVQTDDVKTVQTLLQRGFDPNTVNPNGVAGLMLAVREPSLKVAELLAGWPKAKVEWRNEQDESVLMLAALKGHLPLVKVLLAQDADVNKPGWTPLHYAATGGHIAVMELLLDNSAYIDAESPNGSTPLMMAAMYGSPLAVKLLIQAGADLNVKNQMGLTALDFALRADRRNAKELIETALQRQAARTPTSPTPPATPASASTPALPEPAPVPAPAPVPLPMTAPQTLDKPQSTPSAPEHVPSKSISVEAPPASKALKPSW